MSKYRKDPISGRWVIIAENRALRPNDFVDNQVRRDIARTCPFCEGNERFTPGEVFAIRKSNSSANSAGWQVRVVPNGYPALLREQSLESVHKGIYEERDGFGVHEVIVESPQHVMSTTQLTDEQVQCVFDAYRIRLNDLKSDSRLGYALVFKNARPEAGASIEHAHSQLIATPETPLAIQEEIRGGSDFFERHRTCAWCKIIVDELEAQVRLVHQSTSFIAFCPFAARVPFETWVLPRRHGSHFEQIEPGLLPELADFMKQTLLRMEAVLDGPAYNYWIHTSPFDTPLLDHYHWHIEIIPRLTKIAGFEWGTGCYLNPVLPEEAAKSLRIDKRV